MIIQNKGKLIINKQKRDNQMQMSVTQQGSTFFTLYMQLFRKALTIITYRYQR